MQCFWLFLTIILYWFTIKVLSFRCNRLTHTVALIHLCWTIYLWGTLSLAAGVSSYVMTCICICTCLHEQHVEFTPLGPWPCSQHATSSPAVRSGALTWPVPLAHSERLTRRAPRSAWPTFPLRSLCWVEVLRSMGRQSGRSYLCLHWCLGTLNHPSSLGDTFRCVRVCFRCYRRRPTHMDSHTQACSKVEHEALCGGCS